jgi:LysR family glycine cleavage system transcriptional activator
MFHNLPSIIALNCFEASARLGSFSRAAEELHLTQSAVSRQIKKLEQQLDCKLFERIKQRIYLTDTGKKYHERVVDILTQLAQATLDVTYSVSGRIVLGIEDSLTKSWLIPKLSDFQKKHPEIETEILTDLHQIYETREGYDVGILYGNGDWSEFNTKFLMGEEFVAVCSPALLKQYGPVENIADVLRYPILHHSSFPSSSQYWFTKIGLSSKQIKAVPGIHLELFGQLIESAEHGLGLAILPHYYVKEELRAQRLVLAHNKPLRSDDSYYVVTPKSKAHDPKVKILTNWLLSWDSWLAE